MTRGKYFKGGYLDNREGYPTKESAENYVRMLKECDKDEEE